MEQPSKSKYEIIVLPVEYNKSFLDFNKAEIERYYQWFLNIKGDRLIYLCNCFFTNCDDCLKEEDLNVIEIFLQNSISTIVKQKSNLMLK